MTKKPMAIGLSVAAAGLALAAAVGAQQQKPSPEEIWRAPRQTLAIGDFPAEGLILDIGGGGEGVIGQLKGRQVVAIDLIKRELEDAPPGPLLKIVMDARDLKFLDGSFDTVTVFFTFMYIQPADHGKVFGEIRRVLGPGGRLLIWDVTFPKEAQAGIKYAIYPFAFKLPDRTITTGYGVHMVPGQGLPHFEGLAKEAGFSVVTSRTDQDCFFLELTKAQTSRP